MGDLKISQDNNVTTFEDTSHYPDFFVNIPAPVFKLKLSPSKTLILGYIVSMNLSGKKCFASNKWLAEKILHCGENNIRKHLRELEDSGYIHCIYRTPEKRNRVSINVDKSMFTISKKEHHDIKKGASRYQKTTTYNKVYNKVYSSKNKNVDNLKTNATPEQEKEIIRRTAEAKNRYRKLG